MILFKYSSKTDLTNLIKTYIFQCMNTVTASEAKTHFGALIDRVQHEPVTIQKQGRPVAVLVSYEAYDQQQGSDPKSKQLSLEFIRKWAQKPAPENVAQKLAGDIRAQALWDKYQ